MNRKELDNVLKLHKAYLNGEEGGVKANLSWITLKGLDLKGLDLKGVNFNGTTFFGTDFSGADLSNASFNGATFSGTSFSGANLSDSMFNFAIFYSTNFSGANLSTTEFHRARLHDVNFSGATIDNVDFYKANIYNANFNNTTLDNVDFYRANLDATTFKDATINGEPVKICKTISGLKWHISIINNVVKVGCKTHTYKEWKNFSKEEIEDMHPEALEFYPALMGILDYEYGKLEGEKMEVRKINEIIKRITSMMHMMDSEFDCLSYMEHNLTFTTHGTCLVCSNVLQKLEKGIDVAYYVPRYKRSKANGYSHFGGRTIFINSTKYFDELKMVKFILHELGHLCGYRHNSNTYLGRKFRNNLWYERKLKEKSVPYQLEKLAVVYNEMYLS